MITASMNEEEATKALLQDYKKFIHYSDLNFDKKFRREVLHAYTFPIYRRYTWISPQKNKWTIIYEARNKKEIGDNSRITSFCTVDFQIGKYVFMPTFTNGSFHWIIYPPHLFSRYSQRCELEMNGSELHDRFFKYNASYVYETKETIIEKEGKKFMVQEVYGSTKDGVVMGIYTIQNNILFRTFVTYDMLKGEQIEKFTKNEKIRKEIHGE